MDLKVDETNPWKTLKTEEVHDTPWIKVHKHDVLNPAGKPATYSTVHFKSYALGVIALDDDHNVYLVGQYRFPIQSYSWEIPEGGGSRDVEPIESAKRELSEETGIRAKKWTLIQRFDMSNAATDETAFIYLAQDLSFHDAHPDEGEELVVKKIPFQRLYNLVESGDIKDSLTVVATLKTKILLDSKSV